MDELIRRYDATPDGDLMLCPTRGVAWQRDMARYRVAYDEAYYEKYVGYEGSEIERALTRGRIELVGRHVGADRAVVDIGVGCGTFVAARPNTWGTDINPRAVERLKAEGRYAADVSGFAAHTYWDVIEHIEQPGLYFRTVPDGGHLFCALPVFDDLAEIRQSKHYRPGEHLYYWTERGFVDWMAEYRFRLVEQSDHEIRAGREAIQAFAFVRDRPGYHETLAQYRRLYEPHYGASATGLYLDLVAPLVLARDPGSILDWGCGRSDLAAHFWADGRRRIARFDPAIPGCETMPEGEFDLVLCLDVMEHIRMEDVGRVLAEIRAKSASVLFVISLRPARAKLPDGRNAHVTLLTAGEWTRWISDVLGRATKVATPWDHVLMLRTF